MTSRATTTIIAIYIYIYILSIYIYAYIYIQYNKHLCRCPRSVTPYEMSSFCVFLFHSHYCLCAFVEDFLTILLSQLLYVPYYAYSMYVRIRLRAVCSEIELSEEIWLCSQSTVHNICTLCKK